MNGSIEDYTRAMRGRYLRRRGRQARTLLINEFCEMTGLERKYSIKVLGGRRRTGGIGRGRGRPGVYLAGDVEVLKGVWLAAGQPCGKRLAGEMLGVWLCSWEKRHGALPEAQAARLARISAAQIDREMAPFRCREKKRRIASATLAAMQREVAVRCEPWVESTPGALEIDTVALCGGSMAGAIIWALDATDINSGWTEVRAVWNRGALATRERLLELEGALPFAIRKLDFDNGTEFLNAHLVGHFRGREPKVELSRSRPYRKNDNAHVEQKNYTHVRQLLGDDRFEHQELVEPLNEALAAWSLWNNLYCAQRRLLRKERLADGKIRRHHEKAASTPCARLLARSDLGPRERLELERLLAENDPIELREEVEKMLRDLYDLRARLMAADDDGDEPAPEPTPIAAPRGKAGLRSVRSVASGSHRSLRSGPPCRAQEPPLEADLPKTPNHPTTTPTMVSSIMRHRDPT